MAKAYSADMRQRVIGRVESGASRREAAEHYEVSPSTAVIWVKCFRETGRCAAKPRGGSTSPLEKQADFLLALIEVEPDLTLDEVVRAMRKHKIPGSRTAVWRFFQRHKITFKKTISDCVRLWAQKRLRSILLVEGSGRRLFGGMYPAKKHGPWVVAHVRVVTPSGDPV